MTATTRTTSGSSRSRADPATSLAAAATVVPFVISLIVGLVSIGAVYSSPFAADRVLRAYFDHGTAVGYMAFLQFVSAVALAVFTGLAWAKTRALTPFSAAPHVAAVGGSIAAAYLGLNGVIQWAMARTATEESMGLMRALNYVFFGMGGPAHVAALGLLVFGVSTAAVKARRIPRGLHVASLVLGVVAELSVLSMLTEAATMFIPIGRFLTLIWLLVIGLRLGGETD